MIFFCPEYSNFCKISKKIIMKQNKKIYVDANNT